MAQRTQDCLARIRTTGKSRTLIVSTPYGEIHRTTSRDYKAIAFKVDEEMSQFRGVAFASTLQGAYKTACGWGQPTRERVFYALLSF